ncbi:MAG: carbohydrate kinase [Pseudomonadota bacterium]
MFLVCGEALWDLFAAEGPGGLSFDARIGGSPFNVAMGLARLGERVGLLTGLSTDPLGRRLYAALAREGVAADYLLERAEPTTLSLVDLSADGVPAYAFYGEGAADRALTEADLPTLGPEVWGLHVGSYSLVVEPVGESLLHLAASQGAGRLVTLDPNVRPTVEPDLGLWRHRVAAFVQHADLVKVSAEDLALLAPGCAPEEVAADWLSAGPTLVVVTDGEAGATAYGGAGTVAAPAERVKVVDTVGAGDAFMAALIAGLARAKLTDRAALSSGAAALPALLAAASTAAALTCTRRGADLPRRGEVPGLDAL